MKQKTNYPHACRRSGGVGPGQLGRSRPGGGAGAGHRYRGRSGRRPGRRAQVGANIEMSMISDAMWQANGNWMEQSFLQASWI
ncbi:MAG: hypothetical protein ACLRI7_10295 [Ruthenibacterium lactatiformans]